MCKSQHNLTQVKQLSKEDLLYNANELAENTNGFCINLKYVAANRLKASNVNPLSTWRPIVSPGRPTKDNFFAMHKSWCYWDQIMFGLGQVENLVKPVGLSRILTSSWIRNEAMLFDRGKCKGYSCFFYFKLWPAFAPCMCVRVLSLSL